MSYDIRKEKWIKSIPDYDKKFVLDVGCGKCLYAHLFKNYVGIDKNPQCDKSITTIKDDFHSLPFSNDTFDMVLLFDVLEHTTLYGQVLQEAVRVVKPNGIIIGSTIWIMGNAVETDPEHRHCFTEELLRRVLNDFGIKAEIKRDQDILYFKGIVKK